MTPAPFEDSLRGRIAYDGAPTPLKTALFVIVCLAWLLPGLVGHDPWKSDEALVFGAVAEMVRSGDWITFRIAGDPWLDKAPLFFWVAAACAKVFRGVLALHDAARLASGAFVAGTLALISLTAYELMGERAARMAVLLFIGCLGVLVRAHEMNTVLAGLFGIGVGLYGLALAARLPRIGGAVLGLGMGLAFLGDGSLPLAMLAATALALPLAAPQRRNASYALALVLAALMALPLVALWPSVLASFSPAASAAWLANALTPRWAGASPGEYLGDALYFARILPWYAWPAWPLAAWTLWRARRSLAAREDLQLPLVAFVAFALVLALLGEARDLNAMPLLVPLAILGVAELDSLPRGAASALDWFGMTTFFLFAALLWIGWVGAISGSPEFAAAWIRREVPGFHYPFSFLGFSAAALLTLIWLVVVARSLRSTRRALVNWASGITMVWMLAMTLGGPLVDQARSYRGVANQLVAALPSSGAHCIAGRNLGDPQRALLDYFVGLRTVPVSSPQATRCGVLLAQGSPDRPLDPGAGWTETWRGSRPGDRNEIFILYRRE